MDVDFWPRVHSAKHLSAAQLAARYSSDHHHLAIDDSDGEEDPRAYFPCPFCYIEIEVHTLCSHLQNEHCFDLKNAVCPLCAGNLGKDVLGHFIVHHSSSMKRSRKSIKPGQWSGSSGMVSRELSSFLWSSISGPENANEAAPDLLLSPFLGCISNIHSKESQKDESCKTTADSKGSEESSVGGKDKVGSEERRRRAAFVQDLISSTIF